MLGMGSAMETLCGQAYGAHEYGMLGVYMQRSTTARQPPLQLRPRPLRTPPAPALSPSSSFTPASSSPPPPAPPAPASPAATAAPSYPGWAIEDPELCAKPYESSQGLRSLPPISQSFLFRLYPFAMEDLASGSLDTMISGADKAVLADIVKLTQKQGMKGSLGGWKEFLKSYDRKVGAALSDPLRRSLDVLVAFLKSFNHPKDLMFIRKLLRRYTDHRAIEKHFMESIEESPVQMLVRLTMEHPNYTKHYAFPSYEKDWVILPLGDISKAMKSESMVSVDCEMVLCQDGTEEVVKVCIVDKKLKVKLENLVNPNKGVADYRTEITGVSAEDLVGVKCSLVDIQESMKKLLKNGTVLVGHSLYNDMRALKIEHNCVIDTSYIFRCLDMPLTYMPSLINLCKAVLGYEFRKEGEPHDCRMDAEVAMKLVLAKLENGIDDPFAVVRKVSDSEHAKLLLHRIPVETPCQELRKVFPLYFNFDIQTDLKVRGPYYSTYVVFKDACEADKAFQGIEGQKKKDIEGRLQKWVYLKLSTGKWISFNIRKMAIYLPPEDSDSALKNMPCSGDASQNSKRQRTLSSMKLMKKRSPKFREPPTCP